MIKELTQEQIDKIPYYVETFTRKSFETGKCDRNKINNSINLCYEKVGLEQPKEIIWFDNPKDMINPIINNQISDQISNQVWNQIYNQVYNQVDYQVCNQVRNKVRDQIIDQVYNQVRNKVCNQVYNQVYNQIRFLFGQHDSYLIAFFSFFENEFNLDFDYSILNGLKGMLDSGWWMPYENICLVSERPNFYRFEQYPKLGSLYKPAIEWDGYEIWINDVYEDILE